MTSQVPPEIREGVLTLWLQAFSRDEIAKRMGIGTGTVSKIVKSYRLSNPGFDLYINELASAIRLQRLLKGMIFPKGKLDPL